LSAATIGAFSLDAAGQSRCRPRRPAGSAGARRSGAATSAAPRSRGVRAGGANENYAREVKNNSISRRNFLQLGASFGMLAGLGGIKFTAAQASDYKALVCVFLFGGNDGHNMVVPLAQQQYQAYAAARPGLAISQNQLLPISDATQGTFGLHYGIPEIFVIGGAVSGGKVYGQFPLMTNYNGGNIQGTDYADNRGTMLPQFALTQYGATLAQWFGAQTIDLSALFPTLTNFGVNNLGFMG
jgi:uncharacterized protein (DUF1501 family)